ncbi:multiple monosaccharide ABC transporter substrate-binding protein [Actinacidiphila glaucinigra]|uniref:multiple monosaccharide ABC transporter substrate-binding protein n=1 Tax=Actinacidiphila glaucinigra TaxID=235986 RepID=UPI003D89E00B
MHATKGVLMRSAAPAALTLLLIAASTTACGELTDTSSSVAKVGIALPNQEQTRWENDGHNMVERFKAMGYEADLRFAGDDVDRQVAQVESMVNQGDKVLIIGAVDGFELGEALKKAALRGVKVIAYDRLVLGSSYVDYYASFDNYQVGMLQARYIEDELGLKGGKGPFNIELFAGDPDDNNARFFYNGSIDTLKKYIDNGQLVVRSGEKRITQVATYHWDGEIAEETMQTRLDSAYRSATIDAVLAPNDGIARGVVAALEANGYGKNGKSMPIITGQDAEVDSVKEIIEGQQSMTVYKDTRKLASVTVEMASAILAGHKPKVNDTEQYDNGNKVVPARLLPSVSVDKSNYKKVLVDSGYIKASALN